MAIPCCCLPLATCLTHLAYLGCVFLLYWQKIWLSYACSCQFLPCNISLPWCMVAKLVRKVVRSMQQHGKLQSWRKNIFFCSYLVLSALPRLYKFRWSNDFTTRFFLRLSSDSVTGGSVVITNSKKVTHEVTFLMSPMILFTFYKPSKVRSN